MITKDVLGFWLFSVGRRALSLNTRSKSDILQKHRKSGFALLKIDFKNASTSSTAKQPPRRCFLGWNGGLGDARTSHLCWFTITKGVLFSVRSPQGDPLGPLYFCCG